MKLEASVTCTQAEINQAVAAFLSALGVNITIEPQTTPQPPAKPAKTPSTAPIGQTIDGYQFTHYGYPGDSTPDSNSMAGIGDRANKLVPNASVALTQSARERLFGVSGKSTGKRFIAAGVEFEDDDSAPQSDLRIDVYDPYYTGIDPGCTPEMYAKSKAQMVDAGILDA